MPAMANAQSVALQLEKVRTKVPLMYERDDMLLTMIMQRGDVEKVSTRNMRLPLQLRPGSKGRAWNPDGGDMGRGSGTVYDVAQVTPFWTLQACEINKLVEYATDASEKAVENATKAEVKNTMAQYRSFLDKTINTPSATGSPVVGVLAATGAVSGNQLNLAVPSGASLVYYNQGVQVYDSTLTTNRGLCNITLADPFNYFVQVDTVPAGTTNGDLLVIDGVSGAQPLGIYGPAYHMSNATTGTWLDLNRGTYSVELATPSVNASNGALVPQYVRVAQNRIKLALGMDQFKASKLIAYMNVQQEQAWEDLAISISQIIKAGPGGTVNDKVDLLFNGEGRMGDLPIKTSINANQTTIYNIALAHWGRAISKEIDFYTEAGQESFPIYGTSGGLAASYIFYYVQGMQVWTDSPRSGSYIYNLLVPNSSLY